MPSYAVDRRWTSQGTLTSKRETASTGEMLTLAEAKAYLSVAEDDQDGVIEGMLTAARQDAESITKRTLRAQATHRHTFDEFPCVPYRFPDRPLIAVASIKYYSSANVLTTIDSSDYYVLLDTRGDGWFEWISDYSLPVTYDRPDAVEVIYTSGYISTESIPDVIKQGALLLLKDLYEQDDKARMRGVDLLRNHGAGVYS